MVPSRIRRVRVPAPAAKTPRNESLDKAVICATIEDVAKAQDHLAFWSKALADSQEKLLALMKANKLTTTSCTTSVGMATAEVVRSAGRATNTIDPRGFRKLVTEDDFYDCISVSNTKAKTVLSARELVSVTDTVPGKPGEPTIKVSVEK